MNCVLGKITTYDNKELNGVFFNPSKRNKKALLYVHGFYGHSEILNALSDKFDKLGYGLACFDVRGYDKILERRVAQKEAASQEFRDCIYDIEAGVKFLLINGFSEIVVAGISGGANKAVYYFSGLHNKYTKGLILISPVCEGPIFNDAPTTSKEDFQSFKQKLNIFFRKIKKRFSSRKRRINIAPGFNVNNKTRKDIKNTQKIDYDESAFYESPRPQFNALAKIKEPMLAIFGDQGMYVDRNPKSIIEMFKQKSQATQKFDSKIVAGAGHNFNNKEQELADLITIWMKKI
jgi:alpha-beta hydrolase superfamily lysophospholipase